MVSRRTVVVAGLPVHVFSRVGLGEITGKVAVLFFLHGRGEAAREYDNRAESIVKQVSSKGQSGIDLLVVTIVRLAMLRSRDVSNMRTRTNETTANVLLTERRTTLGKMGTTDMRESHDLRSVSRLTTSA